MKNIFLFIVTLIAVQYAHAGLPPTSSKGDLETGYGTTFQTDYDKIPLTRTGTNIKIGTIPLTMGGTGSTTKNFVDLTTAQTAAGAKDFTSDVTSSDFKFNDPAYNTISVKQALSHQMGTGVVDGAILSINADPTKFDLSQQILLFSDYSVSSTSPTVKFVTCPAIVAGTVTNIAVADTSYISISPSCSVVQQTTFPTQIERRTNAFIGRLAHINHATVTIAATLPDFVVDTNSQLYDLFDAIGAFNISGNIISANGANLSFNKSGGITFRRSVGYPTNKKNPNTVSIAPAIPASFVRLTQNALTPGPFTVIDPASYDVGGVLTAVPNPGATSTNKRVYLFSSGTIAVQYGQQTYPSLAEAIAGVSTESFVVNPTATDGGILLGIISCRKDATNLSLEAQCHITKAGRFDNSGITAGSLATTTLQQAYNNSVTPQITTSTLLGGVDIRRGSAADTDNVLRIQNGAGTPTATVTGAGVITGSNLTGTNTGDLISKGQSEGSTATTTQVQAPLEQLTNLATGVELIETGNDNVLPNPGIEAATINWAGYDDAASTPVDGTSGTVTTTCTDSSSSPLDGTKSLLITKAAANHQGEGCSVPFTIGSSGKYKMHTVRFDYEATHANYADDYIKVYAISSAGAVIEVLAGDNGVKANGNGGTFLGSFQATDATSYRIALHVFDSSSNAWTFKADNIEVSRKQPSVKGAVVTDWKDYTPTVSGLSISSAYGKYRRVGDTMEITTRIIASGASAAVITFSMPPGFDIDDSKLPGSGVGFTIGPGSAFDSSANVTYMATVFQTAANSNIFAFYGNSTGSWSVSSPMTWATSDEVSATVRVPITGWSSNLTLSEDGGQREVTFSATTLPSTTITNAETGVKRLKFGVVQTDTTSSYSTSTGDWTCPESGTHTIYAKTNVGAAASSKQAMGIWKVSSGATSLLSYGNAAYTILNEEQVVSWRGRLLKGDVIFISSYQISGTGTSTYGLNTAYGDIFTVHKESVPQTLAGSETVAANYTNAAGTPVADATDIPFPTKVYDTHNAFNGATGIFTCPLSGKYTVQGAIRTNPVIPGAVGRIFGIQLIGIGLSSVGASDVAEVNASKPFNVSFSHTVNCDKGNTFSLRFAETIDAVSLATVAAYNFISITRVGN